MNVKVTEPTPAANPIPSKVGSRILVNVILDRSGSMKPTRDDTIAGYNEYLSGLRADKETEYNISLTQFDAPINVPELTITYIDRPLKDIADLTQADYDPRGNTPLYDAIGETIRRCESIVAGRPVLCVIITDGQENASTEFTLDKIKELIKAKEQDGWTFTFLGANINAYEVGGAMGASAGNTSNYNSHNIRGTFAETVSATLDYASERRSTGLRGQSAGEKFYTMAQKARMEAGLTYKPVKPAPIVKSLAKRPDWKVTDE